MRNHPPLVLTFAATDPTSGAGIQADLLAIAACGCHPVCAITAITVQDTLGVHAILPVEPDWLIRQARAVLADVEVAAFKIGFAGSAANIQAIAAILCEHPGTPVVCDPVLASGRGDPMAGAEMIAAMRDRLFPLTTLLTPNSEEARRLALRDGEADLPLPECARRLSAYGCGHVLVTGTHERTEAVANVLYDARGEVSSQAWPRLPGSYHGSGCTLAAAIAASLARGAPLAEAVREGQAYTWKSLAAGFRAGRGQFLPDRWAPVREGKRSD